MGRKFYNAFDYDFNTPHGEIVISRSLKDQLDLDIEDEVILVMIEGKKREPDYEGYATIVKVTGFLDAHDPAYIRVQTDLRK